MGWTRTKEKTVEECLGLTDLLDKRKALCKSLSRGMKQRALLAKTLVHEPEVLLLDEPAANLDPKARIDLRNLLRKLASEGKTILVSSHVLSELQDLCDTIGIMKEGTMIHSGTIDEIAEKTNPARTVQVHLTEPFDGIDACLKNFAVVSSVHTVDEDRKRLEFIHDGTSQDEAKVLASLVGKGAKIYRFEPKQSKVEDLFSKWNQAMKKEEPMNPIILLAYGKIADQTLDCGGSFFPDCFRNHLFHRLPNEANGG